jgi:isopenicillin-N N-acyltransferase like protein
MLDLNQIKSFPANISLAADGFASANFTNHSNNPEIVPDRLGGLPVAKLSGTATEIGLQHGKLFAAEIAECFKAYESVWQALPLNLRNEFVDRQRAKIERLFPHYAEEICAIAKGAGVDERIIFTLNGRTEITHYQHQFTKPSTLHGITNNVPLNECTLLGSTITGVMGENWDWAQRIEKITTLLHITNQEGHRILTMSEPGIIGKVGLNSSGIAVGLNFIPGTEANNGVPVHILLRACLDCKSFEEIESMLVGLEKQGELGTMSAISVMDSKGNAEIFEILGTQLISARDPKRSTFEHTNHPVLNPTGYGTDDLDNTVARLCDAKRLVEEEPLTVERLKIILADRSHPEHKINMTPQAWGAIGQVESIRSLIFDTKNSGFHISRGSPGSSEEPLDYDSYYLNH